MLKTLGLVGILMFSSPDGAMQQLPAQMNNDSSYFSAMRLTAQDSSGVVIMFDEYVDENNDDSVDVVRHYRWDAETTDFLPQNSNERMRVLVPLLRDFYPEQISAWTDYLKDVKTLEPFDKKYPRYSPKGKAYQEQFRQLKNKAGYGKSHQLMNQSKPVRR